MLKVSKNGRRLLVVAFWIFMPLLLVSIITRFWDAQLNDLIHTSQPLTNLRAAKSALLLLFGSGTFQDDSWAPMLHALQILTGHETSTNDATVFAKDRLYETLFFDLKSKFQYPPTSLLPIDLLGQFGLASIDVLDRINTVLFVADIIALSSLSVVCFQRWHLIENRGRLEHCVVIGTTIGAAFLFHPLARGYALGQIQIWIDLLFTLGCIAWLRDRKVVAGAMLGIACTIKPQFGLFLIWALLWREWAFAKGVLLMLAPLTLISLARYGIHNHLAYLDVLSFLSKHGEAFWANQSINGIVNRYFDTGSALSFSATSFPRFSGAVHAATLGTSILLLLALVWRPLRVGGSPTFFDFGIAAICITISSPIAWEHHYGIFLPLFVLMLAATMRISKSRSINWMAVMLAISWFLVAGQFPATLAFNDTPFEFLMAYVFMGALILLILYFSQAMRSTNQNGVTETSRSEIKNA